MIYGTGIMKSRKKKANQISRTKRGPAIYSVIPKSNPTIETRVVKNSAPAVPTINRTNDAIITGRPHLPVSNGMVFRTRALPPDQPGRNRDDQEAVTNNWDHDTSRKPNRSESADRESETPRRERVSAKAESQAYSPKAQLLLAVLFRF